MRTIIQNSNVPIKNLSSGGPNANSLERSIAREHQVAVCERLVAWPPSTNPLLQFCRRILGLITTLIIMHRWH